MTKEEYINKIVEVSRKKTPGLCQLTGEKLTAENTADGVNGYAIRVAHPDLPGKSVQVEVSKKAYLDYYKAVYPDAETPKL